MKIISTHAVINNKINWNNKDITNGSSSLVSRTKFPESKLNSKTTENKKLYKLNFFKKL